MATLSLLGQVPVRSLAAGAAADYSRTETPPLLLQIAPPKRLLPAMMPFVQKVFPDHNARALPMLVLGLWGYPEFAGLSDTDPVGFFLVPSTFDPSVFSGVACAHLSENSPLRSALALQRLNVKNFAGWTLIASGGEALKTIEAGGENEFVALAQKEMDHDVILKIGRDIIKFFVGEYERAVLDKLASTGDVSKSMPALALFASLKRFAEQINEISFCGDFRGEIFSGHLELSSDAGSDLSALFRPLSNEADIELVSSAIADAGDVRYVLRYDPQKLCRLVELAIDGIFQGGPNGLNGISERELCTFIERVFSRCNGASAGNVAFGGDGGVIIGNVVGATISADELAAWVDFAFTNVVHALLEEISSSDVNVNRSVSVAVEHKAFSHRGLPVVAALIAFEDMPFGLDGAELPEAARIAMAHRICFCALGDAVAISNGRENMASMVDAFLDGGSEKSLADRIKFAKGDVAAVSFGGLRNSNLELSDGAEGCCLSVLCGVADGSLRIDFTVSGEAIGGVFGALGGRN
ncbi:MAG: hypothetical protein LBI39_01480 [Puniceicoccales bacterium]|nr:hypothetical protein [Puniceicoccales bacterium]